MNELPFVLYVTLCYGRCPRCRQRAAFAGREFGGPLFVCERCHLRWWMAGDEGNCCERLFRPWEGDPSELISFEVITEIYANHEGAVSWAANQ
jgi:hypothetical protein